ncbi:hypothetical protein F542_1770 [Bibersteinia trehalosi USDA-ARS-USMARC-188]|uniref:Uncharacterized protein n=2 Tax=Bibersteinia trehalosi TaxID=47735 RepID=A0A4V7I7C2_BIBTR|nr:hypothetical protein WQG_20810 [Bibersteinia trehalosi USDA-ARS-USMARC-192]AHG80895.1 hypothetical protein F542_1770 [Bibersteinia trehalosi USDA-ARS-USMARC-188]AHG83107.1 hypothetical protein F543_2430 [Bibersteinia trehalosi USDA-ARS-USMARC-189]
MNDRPLFEKEGIRGEILQAVISLQKFANGRTTHAPTNEH